MATKESEGLQPNGLYALGNYNFRLERSSVPGSTNDKIEAICMNGGKNARKSIQVPSSTKLDGWYVEANDTEATVYAVIREREGEEGEKTSPLDTSPYTQPITYCNYIESKRYVKRNNNWELHSIATFSGYIVTFNYLETFTRDGKKSQQASLVIGNAAGQPYYINGVESIALDSYTFDNKSIGWTTTGIGARATNTSYTEISLPINYPNIREGKNNEVIWTAVWGTPTGGDYGDPKSILVGRFAIDIEDAGGVGPGSDWTDPGDYDSDWEEGDPTQTLYVTVTGALSGRHNDPIVDPTYSYIPADKDTVKDYGCGGDGGHGGGGGAGASTVVIHKFATNQADSKEITALARRHGYGSGGGKGGKGGDGCILVYY